MDDKVEVSVTITVRRQTLRDAVELAAKYEAGVNDAQDDMRFLESNDDLIQALAEAAELRCQIVLDPDDDMRFCEIEPSALDEESEVYEPALLFTRTVQCEEHWFYGPADGCSVAYAAKTDDGRVYLLQVDEDDTGVAGRWVLKGEIS
jgi:hypothetical protein